MPFVCTIDPDSIQAAFFQEGGDYLIVIPIGFDDASPLTYSLMVTLSPSGGGLLEYAFCIIEANDVEYSENQIWSGLESARFLKGDDRKDVLSLLIQCTKFLLDSVRPLSVFFCTIDTFAPEKADRKYSLVAQTFEMCGYRVRTTDPWHGQRYWRMERDAGAPVGPPEGGGHEPRRADKAPPGS
ncbi:MAG: hypothetical protein HC900_12290 [Methylacidiphilales bacterium]|nr:hypothetical protein [Candidatus Methylacidiphilales bacterium]